MQPLRVLLIGAGTMGGVHADAYASMPEHAVLAGVIDESPERGRTLADRFGVSFYTALEEVPTDAFDVVDVCVPTPFHKEAVTKAAALSKDIICEKPLAPSVAEAEDMIQTCETYGVKLCVGHVVRFFPQYTAAKQMIASGKIGEVAVVNMFRGGPFPTAWQDWYNRRDYSGGVLLDLMIHDFDFLRSTFGEVDRVFAQEIPERDHLSYATATLRFKSGVIANLTGSWAHDKFHTSFEFAGSQGIIDDNTLKAASLTVHRNAREAGGAQGVSVPLTPTFENPYFKELRHFIEVFRDGIEPIVTAHDGLEAVRISTACMASALEGRPVKL